MGFSTSLTMPKTRFPRAQHGTKYDMENTWERTRPSQPAVVGRDTGTAGSRGADGSLSGRSGGACPGRRRSWWASRTVIKRNPTWSRPRTDVGVQQRSDIKRVTISGQLKPQQLRQVTGMGTWNTLTMHTIGKVETVESEMFRMNIGCLGLAETRWSGKGDFVMDADSTVIYSGSESHKESGVAVILDKERSRSLMGYNPVNSRILSVRLSGRPWNLTLIQVYAPTNQADEQEKENFYTCLQQVYQRVPKQDIVLLSGDFNAKISTGTAIGKHALGSQNDNGERLVQFAQANDLVAANAMLRRHARQMYTWKSHDGDHRNQIDYILVQRRCGPASESASRTRELMQTATTYWLA